MTWRGVKGYGRCRLLASRLVADLVIGDRAVIPQLHLQRRARLVCKQDYTVIPVRLLARVNRVDLSEGLVLTRLPVFVAAILLYLPIIHFFALRWSRRHDRLRKMVQRRDKMTARCWI